MKATAGVVRVNVGGTVFSTLASTLTAQSAYFESLLSGRFGVTHDVDGAIFVDRTAEHFPAILQFLRVGRLPKPGAVDDALLLDESEFYGIDALSKALRERIDSSNQAPATQLRKHSEGCYVATGPFRDFQAVGFGDKQVVFSRTGADDLRAFITADSWRTQEGKLLYAEFVGANIRRGKYASDAEQLSITFPTFSGGAHLHVLGVVASPDELLLLQPRGDEAGCKFVSFRFVAH